MIITWRKIVTVVTWVLFFTFTSNGLPTSRPAGRRKNQPVVADERAPQVPPEVQPRLVEGLFFSFFFVEHFTDLEGLRAAQTESTTFFPCPNYQLLRFLFAVPPKLSSGTAGNHRKMHQGSRAKDRMLT